MNRSPRPWTPLLVSCLAAFALATPRLASAQSRYSGIVVFGTSLSDSGNAFALRGEQSTPPDFGLNRRAGRFPLAVHVRAARIGHDSRHA